MSSMADLSFEFCAVVAPSVGRCARCSGGSIQDSESKKNMKRKKPRERLLEQINFLILSVSQCVESKISCARSVFSTSVFLVRTLGLLPHYSVYREIHTHTHTTQSLKTYSHNLQLRYVFHLLFIFLNMKDISIHTAVYRYDYYSMGAG